MSQAARRGIPGSPENQSTAVAEWLLSCFDVGVETSAIRRMSSLANRRIKQRLKRTLDTASGSPPSGFIIPGPDGISGRVSWLDPNGRLWHRPLDEDFPAGYPQQAAIDHLRQEILRSLAV